MNIAITGHRGLIGSFLKDRLEKEGHKIVFKIDIEEGKNILGMKNIKFNKKIDLMIHAAAYCKINQSIKEPELPFFNNVQGTFEVLEFCRKNNIKKIIFLSSSRVLSKEKNPYTASKVYGEEICKGYFDCYGIEYLIIRPSTVYGPFWDKTKRLMHMFIVNALAGKDLEIYGDPKTKTLDFTYIEDFIDAMMLTINNKTWNKEYNISGREEYNIFSLAKLIVKITKSSSKIVIKDKEIAQPQVVKTNLSEIKKIGYSPKISLKEGVNRCIIWYKEYLKNRK